MPRKPNNTCIVWIHVTFSSHYNIICVLPSTKLHNNNSTKYFVSSLLLMSPTPFYVHFLAATKSTTHPIEKPYRTIPAN